MSVEPYDETVRRKAERMARARRRRTAFWRQIAHVGALGWTFVLPVLGGALVARTIEQRWDRPGLALLALVVSVVLGGIAVWLQVRGDVGEAER